MYFFLTNFSFFIIFIFFTYGLFFSYRLQDEQPYRTSKFEGDSCLLFLSFLRSFVDKLRILSTPPLVLGLPVFRLSSHFDLLLLGKRLDPRPVPRVLTPSAGSVCLFVHFIHSSSTLTSVVFLSGFTDLTITLSFYSLYGL